jgi:alpha-mannosidase
MADTFGTSRVKVLRFMQVLLLACALGNIQSRCVAQDIVQAAGTVGPARVVTVGTETDNSTNAGQTITRAQHPERGIQTLWQIGTIDQSSGEFATHYSAPAYSDAAKDPVFVIGRSNVATDWLPFQPGTTNGKAGYRRHPFTIRFDLDKIPRGRYRLDIALLAYSPRLPRIEIDINGHRGWFYQHPKLAYSAGDEAVFYLPYYSTATVECELSARYLVKGTNTLVLTALDESSPRDDSQPSGFPWLGSSGIVYDGLALRHESASASKNSVSVQPSIYYKRADDHLNELVDVFLSSAKMYRHARVTMILGPKKFPLSFDGDCEFGEQRLEFAIPDNQWTDDGQVVIESDGHSERFSFHAKPARKWTVLLAPNVHLDVGYSDYVPKVAELQSRAVDEAVAMVHRNPEFRFNLDGSWIVEQFMKGRSEEQKARLLDAVKDRKILIPADYASNFTGFSSIESLIRSLYYSANFARENATPFDFNLINDVPNYSWSYASVMAAAGLQYFVAASDSYRAPFLLYNHFNQASPQWWEGPDGGRVLTWYSRHYHQMGSMFGLPPKVANGHDSLPRFLQAFDRPDYKPDTVLLFGTQVENTDLFPEQANLAGEWNQIYAYPKIQYSGFSEALKRIAGQMGDSIPVVRGDGGPYWEDGMVANARLTALARESQQRILTAEKFSSISALVNPVVRPDREIIDRAWKNLLLVDEHTWQAYQSVTDPDSEQTIRQGAMKNSRGENAKRDIDFTLGRALASIADFIDEPAGTLVVFNSLNWKRSDLVETDVDKGLAPFNVVSDKYVPYEIVSSGHTYNHIRFLAEDVPPVGYKSFALKPASMQETGVTPLLGGEVLESPYYRVELDAASGAIRSIFDKELNKDLVDARNPFRFDQYLYVTGADQLPNRLVQYSTVSPVPELISHPSGNGRVISVSKTPFGEAALLESSAPNTPHIETEVRVFDRQKKIEFINHIDKTQVYSKEAAYFAFPFAMEDPQVRYETQNGFVDVRHDLLPGAGLEWFNVQHWISAEQNGLTATLVPIDAPMITLGDIARGTWPTEFGNRKGTVFSYIMSNYTPEGYPAGQGGSFTFRYVLSSANGFFPVANAHLGWGAMTPLESDELMPNDKAISSQRPLSGKAGSFLNIDQPNVTLVTWKLAENGKGLILRLLEMGGKSAIANIDIPVLEISSAWKCTAIEENQEPLEFTEHKVSVGVKPFQIVTVRLEGRPTFP